MLVQEIFVLSIVILAAAFSIRTFVRQFSSSVKGGCSSCSACSVPANDSLNNVYNIYKARRKELV
ncbi:MAG: FeoB-associated Cys-rich membrane protein [Calditrichae bacterium]|nr:FeoB-associated Cys-rich membrane protein [Calditrichota bacterium]MCB9059300.1 FeoB-associated Cys-rich membrane protein [Calditrichia bacterium]